MNAEVGAGIILTVMTLIGLWVAGLIGHAVNETRFERECRDFGKTKIWTTWHECKPMPEKK